MAAAITALAVITAAAITPSLPMKRHQRLFWALAVGTMTMMTITRIKAVVVGTAMARTMVMRGSRTVMVSTAVSRGTTRGGQQQGGDSSHGGDGGNHGGWHS